MEYVVADEMRCLNQAGELFLWVAAHQLTGESNMEETERR